MPQNSPPISHFAPPERDDAEQIASQSKDLECLGNSKALLDSMPDFVMILNSRRQVLFSNKAMRDFLGAGDGKDLLGQRPGEIFRCQQAEVAPGGCGTSEACKTCGAVRAILEGLSGSTACHECRLLSCEGNAFDLRIWARPLEWDGAPCVVVIASDISDAKRRQMFERIFFHDLMNTAGSVWTVANFLQEDASSIDELKDVLFTSAEALLGEIHSQRVLLAAENNDLKLRMEEQSAKILIETAATQMRFHEVASRKTVALDAALTDFAIQTDASLANRVLCNLIKNALEAEQPGATVTVGAGPDGEGAAVFWCHNPSVMPRSVQLQVFQRSFSTKGTGRGLGTYSVRLLVERFLGGHVRFESREGAGTTFFFTLPMLAQT